MSFTAAKHRFEKEFQEDEVLLTVLTSESVGGAGLYETGVWRPTAGLLAWLDGEGLHRTEGRPCSLCWLAEESARSKGGWGFDLKPLTVYRVRCRRHRQRSGFWLLLEVLERDLRHPALEEVLADYNRPVSFTDPLCGTFTLNRRFDLFDGQVDWAGQSCQVYLECDEAEGETAEAALAAFRRLYQAAADWDRRFRTFAARELAGLAGDWQEAPVSEEDFAHRISLSEFSMDPEGSYTAYYDDGDLFFGHVILITGTGETGPEDATIAG